jgi:hypothetical protein
MYFADINFNIFVFGFKDVVPGKAPIFIGTWFSVEEGAGWWI